MNLIEKMVALLTSDEIRVWHYPGKPKGPKFYYWIENEIKDGNADGYGFETLEEMIVEAYKRIDPLLKPIPKQLPSPPISNPGMIGQTGNRPGGTATSSYKHIG